MFVIIGVKYFMHDVWIYLWYICGIFVEYLWNICGIFVEYLWYICGIFVVYLWYICGIFVEYLWYICGIFVVYFCAKFRSPSFNFQYLTALKHRAKEKFRTGAMLVF
jgi:hypothetical protein